MKRETIIIIIILICTNLYAQQKYQTFYIYQKNGNISTFFLI